MNVDVLRDIIPSEVFDEIDIVIKLSNINTSLRLSHFLAQCAHESGNFHWKIENLNYSTTALKKVFGKYFPTDELAREYARKPDRIASRVYANRMGNGDEASKDGWTYRGRGFIQLTGKYNYQKFGESIKIDLIKNPFLVSEKYPLLSAAWFWHTNKLNELADLGSTDLVVKKVTKRINGGQNGIKDRLEKFKKFHQLLE